MTTAERIPVVGHIRQLTAALVSAELTDGQLLKRFADLRDETSFLAILRRHGPLVLGVCRRILGDWHDAEDAFQATFVALAQQAGTIRRPESLGPWLHGVAARTALKARSSAARRRSCEQEAAATKSTTVEYRDDFAWQDLRPVLDEAVASLPDPCRLPFVLCFLAGRTVSEAAQELGWPRGTVATRLAVARQRLRRHLTSRGIDLSAGAFAWVLSGNAASARPPASLLFATTRAATVAARNGMGASLALALGGKAMCMTKMKTVVLVLAVGVAVGSVGLYWRGPKARDSNPVVGRQFAQPHELAAAPSPQLVAKVNGVAIFAEEVYAAAYLSLPDAHDLTTPDRNRRIRAIWQTTLDRAIEREIIWQEVALRLHNAKVLDKLHEVAANNFERRWAQNVRKVTGLKDNDELGASLRAQETSLDAVRRQWERDFIAEEYLRNRASGVREPGATPSDRYFRQEKARIVTELKRQAIIELIAGL
jgi:RNA polymerase sigma factor (sigma-70 family)